MPIPHQFADRIIRGALYDPKNLRDLLETVLGDIADGFDYDSVEYDDREFLLPELRRREADVLCRLKFREDNATTEVWVCILIEHLSDEDHSAPLRVLEYAVSYWRHLWDDGPANRAARLPGMIPIVFFTGQGR